MSSFFDLIAKRKSIRSFLSDVPSREIVTNIIQAGISAPTNCNQQLWDFIVVTNSDTKERLIKEAASNTLIRRAPIAIVITYDGWNYKEAIQGASLALGHMLLAAEELGVGALPMNSYGADSKIKSILGIPDSNTICCFMLIGYPDERAQRTTPVNRRPVNETIHWERFQTRNKAPYTYDPSDWTLDHLRMHQAYYSRKTFAGKEMDIMNSYERLVVKEILSKKSGPIADIFSYDGAYLREFPDVPLTTIDTTPETANYTKAALALSTQEKNTPTNHVVYDKNSKKLLQSPLQTITLIYKLERTPFNLREHLFKQIYESLSDQGELIIVARKSNIFLWLYFFIIKTLFGNDIRKTGIYAFFGPYEPISRTRTLHELRRAGFTTITWFGLFPIPPFYEQAYQMFLQYRKSEGSSYLHREVRVNIITKIIGALLRIQGMTQYGIFGSTIVITFKK